MLYTADCAPEDELTVKAMVVRWLSEPEVPVTVTVAVPRVAVPEAVNVVAELKLFWLAMVIVLVPLAPWFTVSE